MAADHVQQQILDWIAATLKAAHTLAGPDSVFDEDRFEKLAKDECPAIKVLGPGGGGDSEGTLNDEADYDFNVAIECWVIDLKDVARKARQLGAQVQTAIFAAFSSQDESDLPFVDCGLRSEPSYACDSESDDVVGRLTLNWSFTYRIADSDPTTPIF